MTYHQVGNTHKSRTKEIRAERALLTSRLVKKPRFALLRNKIPRQSSPYVGWFCHAPPLEDGWHRLSNFDNSAGFSHHPMKQKFSPYVGFLRHSPPSAALFNEKKHYIFKGNRSKIEGDRVAEYFNSMVICSYVGGRLLGGKPMNRNSTLSELVELAFQSAKREQRNSNSSTEPLDSLEILNTIGALFLSPIACDDDISYEGRHDEFVDVIKKTMDNFVIPLFHSLIKRVMLGQRNKYGFNHSLGIREISDRNCAFHRNKKSGTSAMDDTLKSQHSHPISQEKNDSNDLNSSNTKAKKDESKPINTSGTETIHLPTRLSSEPLLEDDRGQKENDNSNEAGNLEWSWIDISKHVSKECNDDQSWQSDTVQDCPERADDEKVNPDGTVPSWSFTSLGGSLARNIFD